MTQLSEGRARALVDVGENHDEQVRKTAAALFGSLEDCDREENKRIETSDEMSEERRSVKPVPRAQEAVAAEEVVCVEQVLLRLPCVCRLLRTQLLRVELQHQV
jgi:hypothetical protein